MTSMKKTCKSFSSEFKQEIMIMSLWGNAFHKRLPQGFIIV